MPLPGVRHDSLGLRCVLRVFCACVLVLAKSRRPWALAERWCCVRSVLAVLALCALVACSPAPSQTSTSNEDPVSSQVPAETGESQGTNSAASGPATGSPGASGPGEPAAEGQDVAPGDEPWNEGKTAEQIEAERREFERVEGLRADIIPAPTVLDVAGMEVYPSVGRDPEFARETTYQVASSFAEAVAIMIGDGHFDADVLELPGRAEPVSYPRESSYVAMAASRRRGVALGSDTFYRPVSDRVWTAVFTSSARDRSGVVQGFCFGVFVQARPSGEVLVGVEPVQIRQMVPGTARVPSRIRCMPGKDNSASEVDSE